MAIADLPPTPVPFYLGLALTAPSDLDPGIEVAGLGYRRVLVNFVWPGDSTNVLANSETFEWPRATGFWGDVGWITLWDLDGHYVSFGPVVDPVTEATPSITRIDRGDIARVKAGDIVLSDGPPRSRPFGLGLYGFGPYSRSIGNLLVQATLQGTFAPAESPCPGASRWVMEALPSS